MRMDEYQKWLEDQFFDEDLIEEAPPQPTAVVHEMRSETEAQPELVAIQAVSQTIEAQPGANYSYSEPAISEPLPPVDTAPVREPILYETPTPAYSAPPPPAMNVVPLVDGFEVPSIENYLPFLRRTPPAEPAPEASPIHPEAVGLFAARQCGTSPPRRSLGER